MAAMAVLSAGLLVWRRAGSGLEVLIVHPGGPFWARRDEGAWSLPKGEVEPGGVPLDTARREFREELGLAVPEGPLTELGEIRQAGSKRVVAWALESDLDLDGWRSNTFEIEWPPRSGRRASFPEIDRAEWCALELAAVRLNPAQRHFLGVLEGVAAEKS
jgi:predicted NUDIX family NTP pyrophosphohydrolase